MSAVQAITQPIVVKPVEYLGPRRIYIASHRGETFWTLDDATELLIGLTAAIERAIDPTPLPEPEPTPRKLPQPKPTTNLEDLA